MKPVILLAAAMGMAVAATAAQADGDAKKGERQFAQCKTCHTLEEGKNRVGPSLHGLFGRKAASVPKFAYSPGLKAAAEKGLVWDEEKVKDYLKDPNAFLKKYLGVDKVTNKMPNKFPNEDLRENIIAYLKQATK